MHETLEYRLTFISVQAVTTEIRPLPKSRFWSTCLYKPIWISGKRPVAT